MTWECEYCHISVEDGPYLDSNEVGWLACCDSEECEEKADACARIQYMTQINYGWETGGRRFGGVNHS